MIKTNVEIAKIVKREGYNFKRALQLLDEMRTPEEEGNDLTESQMEDMVMDIEIAILSEEEEEE